MRATQQAREGLYSLETSFPDDNCIFETTLIITTVFKYEPHYTHYRNKAHSTWAEENNMKYAITPDNRIHAVTNEEAFYENFPDAQDITTNKNSYKLFELQQSCKHTTLTADESRCADCGINQEVKA